MVRPKRQPRGAQTLDTQPRSMDGNTPMTRRRYVLLLTAMVLAVGLAWAAVWLPGDKGRPQDQDVDLTRLDLAQVISLPALAHSIAVFEARARGNPQSFIDYALLGDLHLSRARESGDAASLLRAEAAFQKSLEINPGYMAAQAGYASAVYPQHRFQEALEWAAKVPERNGSYGRVLAVTADSYLSLGRYEDAEAAYRELAQRVPGPTTTARLAQMEFLHGNTAEALRLAGAAATSAYLNGTDAESMAWYLSRIGELHFGQGDLDAAAKHYSAALRVFDRHYASLAGLGRVRAAQGKLDEAAALYARAADIVPQPSVLAALGDVQVRAGRADLAQTQYETVELIARLAEVNNVIYNRELVLYYADHATHHAEAVALAEAEIEARQDVHGYDALAWALYRVGRVEEAEAAIVEALNLGTREASFHFHAGLIYRALGRDVDAAAALSKALEINPHFSLLHADEARAALAALRRADGQGRVAGAATR